MSERNPIDEQPQELRTEPETPRPEMPLLAKQVCMLFLLAGFSVGLALSSKEEILLKLLGWAMIVLFVWLIIRIVFFVKTR